MALDPIPHVVATSGDSADAPSGAIPVALYGVESGGEAPVTSVNGEIGAVVLAATDVGAAPTTHTHTAADIASGTLADARIPALAIAKITGLEARLTAIEGRLDALETPEA